MEHSEILDHVKQIGLQHFNGDEALAQTFADAFEKQASAADLYSGLAKAVGAGIGAVAIGGGLHVMNKAMGSINTANLHGNFEKALATAMQTNRVLRDTDPEKVKNYANTIFRFAPHVAGDVNLLSSVLANAVHGDGIDPMTIRSLTDLEGRYVDNRSTGAFSPKAYV